MTRGQRALIIVWATVLALVASSTSALAGLPSASAVLHDGPAYGYDTAGRDYDHHANLAPQAVENPGRSSVLDRPVVGVTGHSVVSSAELLAPRVADDFAEMSGILRDATRGKGNFGLGSATASQADDLGRAWVGEGWRWSSDGVAMVSSDGIRVFRPPTWKPSLGRYQANFEYWVEGQLTRRPFGNGHLDITDLFP